MFDFVVKATVSQLASITVFQIQISVVCVDKDGFLGDSCSTRKSALLGVGQFVQLGFYGVLTSERIEKRLLSIPGTAVSGVYGNSDNSVKKGYALPGVEEWWLVGS